MGGRQRTSLFMSREKTAEKILESRGKREGKGKSSE